MRDLEYWLLVAVAFAAFVWSSHRRAVRRADRRGDPRPQMAQVAWQIVPVLIALGIGVIAGFVSLVFMPRPGEGWGGIVYLAAAYLVGFVVAGVAWLLLVFLGPIVQVGVAVVTAGVLVYQFGLPSFRLSPVSGHARPLTAQEKAMAEVYHGPDGVVPDQLRMERVPGVVALTNISKVPLAVGVARVVRKKEGGVERCRLSAEEKQGVNFEPEIWPGDMVTFSTQCDPRLSDGLLEFRVSLMNGKKVYMSMSAFLP